MVSDTRLACGGAVGGQSGVVRVTPYKAADLDRPVWCHTRVQGLGVDGGMSNSVQLNLKAGEITPYWTVAVNTLVPELIPAGLDSATLEIGQLSAGLEGRHWTAPGTKSDSCPVGCDGAGRDGLRGRAERPDALGMRTAGWLNRAQGAVAANPAVLLVPWGGGAEPVRWRRGVRAAFTAGPEGWRVVAGTWQGSERITCTSLRLSPGASCVSAGRQPEMREPDGFISTAPSRGSSATECLSFGP